MPDPAREAADQIGLLLEVTERTTPGQLAAIIRAAYAERDREIAEVLASLVGLIAGDQHDEGEIDMAFSLSGLGARVNRVRAALTKLGGNQ
jgi:hypothetical protein